MRMSMLTVLVLVMGCSSDGVSKGDAQKLLAGLVAAKDAPPDDRVAMMASVCADLDGCAKGCAAGLKAYAAAPPDGRPAALADGCADAKKFIGTQSAGAAGKATANFVVDRVSKYVAKATDSLDGAEKKQLNEARVALRL